MKKISVILTVILAAIMLISCPGVGEDPPADDPAPLTYTIIYYGNDSDGGTIPSDSNAYEEGMEVTVEAAGTMTQAGYTFTGWNTVVDGSGTDRAAGSTFTMGTTDITLYAQWGIGIIFDKNDMSAEGTMAPQIISNGSTINLSANTFSKAGWTFAGWATSSVGIIAYSDQGSYTMGAVSITLYAKWASSLDLISNWTVEGASMEAISDGIKISGIAYRSQGGIYANDSFNISDTDIYIKWLANGGGTYASFTNALLDSGRTGGFVSPGHTFTTGSQSGTSVLINEDTWYYSHFRINSDHTYTYVTCINDYDDNAGTLFNSYSGTILDDNWLLCADDAIVRGKVEDNYSTSAFFVFGEVRIIH